MPATDTGLYSLIYEYWELCSGIKMAHIPGNQDAPGMIARFHATLAAESTRLLLPFVLVLTKMRQFRLPPLVRKPLPHLTLFFGPSKSTNVGNNMSKVQSFPSIIVGMACD